MRRLAVAGVDLDVGGRAVEKVRGEIPAAGRDVAQGAVELVDEISVVPRRYGVRGSGLLLPYQQAGAKPQQRV